LGISWSGAQVAGVSLIGYDDEISWRQEEQGLSVELPEKATGEYAGTLKIQGVPTA
jgi:hypothetical protein